MTADTNPAAVTGDGETEIWYLIKIWSDSESSKSVEITDSVMAWGEAILYLSRHLELVSMSPLRAAARLRDLKADVRIVTSESPEFEELARYGLTTGRGVTAEDRDDILEFIKFIIEG